MIDILVPTLGRPERLEQMMDSAYSTAEGFIEFYVSMEADDSKTIQWLNKKVNAKMLKGKFSFSDKMNLSQHWNRLYSMSTAPIVMQGADDIIFETKGWDTKVIRYFRSLPDMIGLWGAADGHNETNITHGCVSRVACKRLGYFVPPYFEADFNDTWLHTLYESIGRICWDKEVMIRHNHRNVDARFDDNTYRIAEERRVRAAKVWEEKYHQIEQDAKKLK